VLKSSRPDRRLAKLSVRLKWRIIGQPIVHGPMSRLRVGAAVGLGNVLINTWGGFIDIGDYVFFGHDVLLLTGTHDFREKGPARQVARQTLDRSITIENGAWITSGAVIVGPCRIGSNAVVGSGCIIDFDVPPDTIIRLRQEYIRDTIKYLDPQ
jgi:acetyltransferase-like isoleucine patch superfamily enzyme